MCPQPQERRNMEIIYFELNNWMSGRDYPDAEPFITWCSDDYHLYFSDENWVKENKWSPAISEIRKGIYFEEKEKEILAIQAGVNYERQIQATAPYTAICETRVNGL